jgi:hypothetical protein
LTVAHIVFAVLRLLLTFVFMLPAVTKLTDRGGFRKALAGFAVPERLQVPVAALIPMQEPGIATRLLPAARAKNDRGHGHPCGALGVGNLCHLPGESAGDRALEHSTWTQTGSSITKNTNDLYAVSDSPANQRLGCRTAAQPCSSLPVADLYWDGTTWDA